jgi:hypothetical protein
VERLVFGGGGGGGLDRGTVLENVWQRRYQKQNIFVGHFLPAANFIILYIEIQFA